MNKTFELADAREQCFGICNDCKEECIINGYNIGDDDD